MSQGVSTRSIPCPFCCHFFYKTIHLARHVRISHKSESRCAAAAAAALVASHSFIRVPMTALAIAPGPGLLDAEELEADAPAGVGSVNASQDGDVTGAAPVVWEAAASVPTTDGGGDAPRNREGAGVDPAALAAAADVPAAVGGCYARRLQDPDSFDGSALIGAWIYASADDDEDFAADDDHMIGAAAVDLLAALPRQCSRRARSARSLGTRHSLVLSRPHSPQRTASSRRRTMSKTAFWRRVAGCRSILRPAGALLSPTTATFCRWRRTCWRCEAGGG